LFQEAGNNIEEEQALDSAIRSLHLFRSTFKKGAASWPRDAHLLRSQNSARNEGGRMATQPTSDPQPHGTPYCSDPDCPYCK
jgi:hypothetical protein